MASHVNCCKKSIALILHSVLLLDLAMCCCHASVASGFVLVIDQPRVAKPKLPSKTRRFSPNAPTARVATARGSENSGHFCKYPSASAFQLNCERLYSSFWIAQGIVNCDSFRVDCTKSFSNDLECNLPRHCPALRNISSDVWIHAHCKLFLG